jgi:hypothetical protein
MEPRKRRAMESRKVKINGLMSNSGMRKQHLSNSQEHHRKRAEACFKKPAPPEAERAKAKEEVAAQATRDKTARLRSQRLAREASDKETASNDAQT